MKFIKQGYAQMLQKGKKYANNDIAIEEILKSRPCLF